MANRQYPAMVYSAGTSRVVQSDDEFKALTGKWFDSPADVPDAQKDANGTAIAAPESTPRSTGPDLPLLGRGYTYEDRVNWQMAQAGIKIDQRWSTETKLKKLLELQPAQQEGIDAANDAVPDAKKFDFDPALVGDAAKTQELVDAKVAEVLAAKPSTKAEKAA